MKTRSSTILAVGGGVVAAACFVALVIGMTHLLAPGRESPRGPALAQGRGPGGDPGVAPMPPVFVAPPQVFDINNDFEPFDIEALPEGGGPGIAMPGIVDPFTPARAGERPALPEEVKAVKGAAVATAEHKITGPFAHGQLSVFLVHGKAAGEAKGILTLQEALERGVATVHGSGISIDNRSGVPIFVQGGDVIKGGTQDRVLPYDTLIPASATRFPLQAFCVESGRSFPRAGESSVSFSTSNERLPTRELRLAAYGRNQGGVWTGVANLQAALGRAIGADVRSPLSRTSLQLTLEHPLVENKAQEFLTPLIRTPDKSEDVLGMVVFVNGKITSADVYASPELFQKFWPKLLKAAAVEAMAEGSRVTKSVDATVVREFLAVAESGSAFRAETGGLTHLLRREHGAALVFDTCQGSTVLHRSLISR